MIISENNKVLGQRNIIITIMCIHNYRNTIMNIVLRAKKSIIVQVISTVLSI